MANSIKKIAILGGNKEGLKLLPILLKDKSSKVCLMADPNREAMLFKLKELGYRLAPGLGIEATSNLDDVKRVEGLDIIIDALQSPVTEKFLESPEFRDIEKLGPLSTRLLWGVRATAPEEARGKATEQSALLTSLREIVDAVRLTIDRKELFSVILKLASESTGAERGSIMLVSPETSTLSVEIAKGMDEEVVRKIRVPIGDGVSGRVAATGKPLLVSGKADNLKFERPMDRTDVKSAMCVPLVVDGEIIGVINVNSSDSPHVFTEEDLRFLSSLAGLAAEVIQRSNEYEKLKVDAAKFTFWKKADSIMSSILPIEQRLTRVARDLVDIIPGLTCFIYIYDEESARLFLRAASIRDAKSLGQLSLRAGEGLEGQGLESGEDVFLVDRTGDGAIKRVYMNLPMISHGRFVGTFSGHLVSPQGISGYHESFLKDIRDLVAAAVYKHKMDE
ncbi:MAG: GAF domain-containing protein, partial [Thermodesulfobacteriota bacterium]